MTASAEFEIRPYRNSDASATFAIFQDAVTVTASHDYSPEQIAAWVGADRRDLADWDRTMSARNSIVACMDGEIVGFSDVDSFGYIDMLFVSPRHGRQGVATAMLARLHHTARNAGATSLSANVSITARPFFERHGFTVEAEQHPVLDGVRLNNFHMIKPLR